VSNSEDAPAWFGKIAGLGDFASRRLNQEVAGALDTWLAQGIETSRAQLGEHWLNAYLTSPLWRFAWAPGVLDASWWFGVMMPSVDNVGRYFPLVVLQSRSATPTSGDALMRLEQWYAGIADAALRTLQPDSSLERFEADLQQAAQSSPLPIDNAGAPWATVASAERIRCEIPAGAPLAAWIGELTVSECVRRIQGCSLWWSLRPGVQGASSASMAIGLPAPLSFARILDGTW